MKAIGWLRDAVDKVTMLRSLISRGISAHSVIQVSYTLEEATQTRDALAKAIYGNLFDWLIRKSTQHLQWKDHLQI